MPEIGLMPVTPASCSSDRRFLAELQLPRCYQSLTDRGIACRRLLRLMGSAFSRHDARTVGTGYGEERRV